MTLKTSDDPSFNGGIECGERPSGKVSRRVNGRRRAAVLSDINILLALSGLDPFARPLDKAAVRTTARRKRGRNQP
jgi:hypothetical protein